VSFCQRCGKPTEKIIPEGDDKPRDVCTACGHIHSINPRIIVGTLPVKDGKILLCKRNIEPRKGHWTLPAGFMEVQESLEQGARRETMEESGGGVAIERLHCTYSLPHVDQVYLLFLAEVLEEVQQPGFETEALQYVTPDEIPWDDLAFRSITFALEKYVESLASGYEGLYAGEYFRESDELFVRATGAPRVEA